MFKVLITGIRGFTGRYLATELSAQGYDVSGLVHAKSASDLDCGWNIHACDLGDIAGLSKIIEQVQPDMVAHLAAIAFVAHGNVDSIYQTNLLGTRNLLEALVRANIRLKSVLLASSANIYGNGTGGVLTESTPPAPANDYAVSKLAMEYVAALYANRLPIVIARPFNYTGVGQSEDFLLPKIISHIRHRSPTIELGNLDVARDFSDVRRVVRYYRRLLECPVAVGETFNVCSGQAHTLKQVLDMACTIAGFALNVQVNPAFVRANEVKILVGCAAKLESVVGKEADIALIDTLRWMIEAN